MKEKELVNCNVGRLGQQIHDVNVCFDSTYGHASKNGDVSMQVQKEESKLYDQGYIKPYWQKKLIVNEQQMKVSQDVVGDKANVSKARPRMEAMMKCQRKYERRMGHKVCDRRYQTPIRQL